MSKDPLREQLLELLGGAQAHAPFAQVVANFPPELRGATPPGLPHSAWMLVEHMRIAQWDILDFSRNPKYQMPKWPEDYWPKTASPPSLSAWEQSLQGFAEDLQAMMQLVQNPQTDLFAPIAWGDGQTILREALLIADHNSHHLGQLIDLRRLLGVWNPK